MHAGALRTPNASMASATMRSPSFSGERLVGLVLEAQHAATFVVIAHPAFEACVATAGRIGELRAWSRARWLGAEENARIIRPPPAG